MSGVNRVLRKASQVTSTDKSPFPLDGPGGATTRAVTFHTFALKKSHPPAAMKMAPLTMQVRLVMFITYVLLARRLQG